MKITDVGKNHIPTSMISIFSKEAGIAFENTRRREVANAGCKICPFCGTKTISLWVRDEYQGFFKTRCFHVNMYSCIECGAKWESEPYEYDLSYLR